MIYTLVLGVDDNHVEHLRTSWPTWVKHKPSMTSMPIVVFSDSDAAIRESLLIIGRTDVVVYKWPEDGVVFEGDENTKWYHPQRYKMLAGFVHVPPKVVETKYWLKLDLDVVAVGDDSWVDSQWFIGDPAIVAHPWGYTKPPDQMQILDMWATNVSTVEYCKYGRPLDLRPDTPSDNKVKHPRIISWCSFYNTEWCRIVSKDAEHSCGPCKLPVPSQDGYMWFHATRSSEHVVRVNMKSRGWRHCSSLSNMKKVIGERNG